MRHSSVYEEGGGDNRHGGICRKLDQLSYGWVPMSVSKGEIRSEEDPVSPGSRRRADARSNSAEDVVLTIPIANVNF